MEETQSTREVIEYEGGEVVTLPDGKRQLRPGKVKSVRREIRTHPPTLVLFFTLNREDFSFVIHLDRQPRTSRRREAQTGSRARSGSRSERTLDAVEHSRTLMEWWPFLIFHRGGLRIKVINNNCRVRCGCSSVGSLTNGARRAKSFRQQVQMGKAVTYYLPDNGRSRDSKRKI